MNLGDFINERVLLLDGSMGVELHRRVPDECGVRGRRFMTHPRPLVSNLDIMNLSRPEIVASVHDAYLEAGADIIETNTFNSNAPSQRQYATDHLVRELNISGARIAVERAQHYTALDPTRPRFVAGSIGPTPFPLSHEAYRPVDCTIDFDTLAEAYAEQTSALIEGGVDVLLIETVYDLENVKAALKGVAQTMGNQGKELPIIVSMTVSEKTGRLFSGHTPDELLAAVAPYKPVAVGFNCMQCTERMSAIVRHFAETSPYPLILYPNAGLPDSQGKYNTAPEQFLTKLKPLLKEGQIKIAGGCCGTTPTHITRLNQYLSETGSRPYKNQ